MVLTISFSAMRCLPAITQPILNGTHRSFFPLHFHRDFADNARQKPHTLWSPLLFTFIIIERCTINFSVDCFYSFPEKVGGRSSHNHDFKAEKTAPLKWYLKHWMCTVSNLIGVDSFFNKNKNKNYSNASKKLWTGNTFNMNSTISSIPIRVYIRVFWARISITVLMYISVFLLSLLFFVPMIDCTKCWFNSKWI